MEYDPRPLLSVLRCPILRCRSGSRRVETISTVKRRLRNSFTCNKYLRVSVMDLGIAGKTALVTAAGGGLGSEVVRRLLAEGAKVVACDIARNSLETLAGEYAGSTSLETYAFDLADTDETQSTLSEVAAKHGGVDILVNITGGPPPGSAGDLTATMFADHVNVMVAPIIRITSAVLPYMREAGWGRIITSTSSGVIAPIANLVLSNSLRMSLVGWSKTLAGEVAHQGVTTNIVVPGRIYTSRIEALDQAAAGRQGISVEEVREKSTATIPARRYGTPREYADVITFLASERSSYITGSTIRVDGGLIASI